MGTARKLEKRDRFFQEAYKIKSWYFRPRSNRRTIAKRAKAFEAEIHYHSRSQKNNDYHFHVSPKELAENVDVLFVITPGGNDTKHLVDESVLKALGKSGTLINVSRGSVVDETALIKALQTGLWGCRIRCFRGRTYCS